MTPHVQVQNSVGKIVERRWGSYVECRPGIFAPAQLMLHVPSLRDDQDARVHPPRGRDKAHIFDSKYSQKLSRRRHVGVSFAGPSSGRRRGPSRARCDGVAYALNYRPNLHPGHEFFVGNCSLLPPLFSCVHCPDYPVEALWNFLVPVAFRTFFSATR